MMAPKPIRGLAIGRVVGRDQSECEISLIKAVVKDRRWTRHRDVL